MPDAADGTVIAAGDDPAFRAWRELRGDGVEPEAIEVLDRLPKGSPWAESFVCRLLGVGPSGSAVVGKRCRTANILVEHTIYREILPQLPVAALHCFGYVTEPDGEHSWLFLEDAGGEPYCEKIQEHRALGAQWLGLMHVTASRLAIADRLPERGPRHYLQHLHAGCDTIRRHLNNPALRAEDVELLETILSHCDIVASRWTHIERAFEGVPCTLVHGDFVPKNARVRTDSGELMLLDWEMAGWGIPAPDLLRVDLPTYCSVVGPAWPRLDLRAAQRLAQLGVLLRYLAAVDWESRWLAHEWVTGPMQRMHRYAAGLAEALRVAGCEECA